MQQTSDVWTIRRLLEWTGGFFTRKEIDYPRLTAELLLSHVLSLPRIKLYTEYERPVGDDHLARYRGLVKRAAEHEPIAYLTGRAHFFNLEFEVTRDVLIPRPDTETIVEHLLQHARLAATPAAPRILELCTGSGCIAAAIATNLKNSSVLAIDNSPAGLEVARKNIERLHLADRVVFALGDLYEPLKSGITAAPFDAIVANPPYIPTANIAQLDRNVREYEPRSALDGGADGLAVIRRILDEAPARLGPAGRLYVEVQFDQGPTVVELARAAGLTEARIVKDHNGNDRVLIATT